MFLGKKEMPIEFCQKGSVKYFYFYHFIILSFNEHYFHWKTIWDIFQNLWASEPHRERCEQGVPVYFIYAGYKFLYLKNQTKLTSEGKENSLHNIKAGTL